MKVGFLGAGDIAHTLAGTMVKMPEVELYAVAARDAERAAEFAKTYGFARSYGSYEELLRDPDVDMVYINTIISCHAEQIEQCILAGKAVLCEKAFTVNGAEARRVLELARERSVLVAEAIWTRYMPLATEIRKLVQSGELGEILSVSANLAYPVYHRPRLQRPEQGGGALLDIGIYPLTFASLVLGDNVTEIYSDVEMSDTGVDKQSHVILTYESGQKAYIYNSCDCVSDRMGSIVGTKGCAVVHNINCFRGIDIYGMDSEIVRSIPCPPQISGYEYQVLAVKEALEQGWLECPQAPHATIITMMELMDRIRACWPNA